MCGRAQGCRRAFSSTAGTEQRRACLEDSLEIFQGVHDLLDIVGAMSVDDYHAYGWGTRAEELCPARQSRQEVELPEARAVGALAADMVQQSG